MTGSSNVFVNGRPVVRMCDTGIHIACCATCNWEAVQGSATVRVNGRSVVRVDDTTKHCGGMGKMIDGSGSVTVGGVSVLGRPIEEVAAYIHAEMVKNINSQDVAYIKDNLGLWQWDNLIPFKADIDLVQAYKKWYDMVRTGGPWDHKTAITKKFGKWAYDAHGNQSYNFETWSNIHYGFVGRAADIQDWDLLAGAGVAQYMDGHTPPGYLDRRMEKLFDADVFAALDESEDQEAIRIGMDLWEKHGRDVTVQDIIDAVRASSKLKAQLGIAC
jgi:uncharacterized Zn-binding protein involved in type VI secretion